MIFVYSLVFTASVSFLAVALIPDSVRPQFYDNLISGLAMHLVGPQLLRLVFQVFVVVVGFLILAGAVNTAIVGSNAVLNRVSEDGVLPDWFRKPHKRFGTTYRILNLIVGLQLLTILLSRGDVYILGEAYAFGVIWSFALKSLSVLVLRFKEPSPREWRVPLNLKIGSVELPVGLAAITLALLSVAVVNLFTKQVATIAGAELHAARLRRVRPVGAGDGAAQEGAPRARPVPVAACARRRAGGDGGPAGRRAGTRPRLEHARAPEVGAGPHGHRQAGHRGDDRAAPARARHRVPGFRRRTGVHGLRTAALHEGGLDRGARRAAGEAARRAVEQRLRRRGADGGEPAVVGHRGRGIGHVHGTEMAHRLGKAWDRIEKSKQVRSRLVAYKLTGEIETFLLGPHAPTLSEEDLELIHRLWLDAVNQYGLDVHHRDVVRAALEEMERDLAGYDRARTLARIAEQVKRPKPEDAVADA